MKAIVFSCSLSPESKSRILAVQGTEAIRSQGAEAEMIGLETRPLPVCGASGCWEDATAREYKAKIAAASVVLLSTPIYNYDANAACKNLIELTGDAWENKVVGFLCSAGGKSSYMSIMGLANSLMLDFRCVIVPRFVYATGDAVDQNQISSPEILERITALARQAVQLGKAAS